MHKSSTTRIAGDVRKPPQRGQIHYLQTLLKQLKLHPYNMFIDNILLIPISFRYHESLRASLFDLCIHHEAHEVYVLFFVFSVCFVVTIVFLFRNFSKYLCTLERQSLFASYQQSQWLNIRS